MKFSALSFFTSILAVFGKKNSNDDNQLPLEWKNPLNSDNPGEENKYYQSVNPNLERKSQSNHSSNHYTQIPSNEVIVATAMAIPFYVYIKNQLKKGKIEQYINDENRLSENIRNNIELYDSYIDRSYAREGLGKYLEAVDDLQKALSVMPKDLDNKDHKSYAKKKTNNKKNKKVKRDEQIIEAICYDEAKVNISVKIIELLGKYSQFNKAELTPEQIDFKRELLDQAYEFYKDKTLSQINDKTALELFRKYKAQEDSKEENKHVNRLSATQDDKANCNVR